LTTSLDALRGSRSLHAVGYPAFRRAWLGGILNGVAVWMERLAVGWLVLHETGSVFLAALSFAVRTAPNIAFGPVGGAVADRFERARVLRTTTLVRAALLVAMAALAIAGVTTAWPLLVLVALMGIARTSEVPATQALITDIVGTQRAANAIALNSLGALAVGVGGAFAGGFLIEWLGAGAVFLVAAGALVVASGVYATVHVPRSRTARGMATSLWRDALEGLRITLRIPVVRLLLLLAVGIEVFAFSYQSLLPAVADRVLHVDAAGLGALTLCAGLGAIAGNGVLSTIGDATRRGPLLIAVTALFGGFLVAFAASSAFALSLALVAGIGAMAAMFDALQWVLLQASVPDEMRGRVIGGWMSAIGFGWLGPLTLGAIAEAAGTPWALTTSGTLVIALAVVAAGSRGLRRL
jgi:MFS family permease